MKYEDKRKPMFNYNGSIVLSKSWLNRALIIQEFSQKKLFNVCDTQIADDVIFLQKALASLGCQNTFDVGMGGTTFRFLTFLLSRKVGEWSLNLHSKLAGRPQTELVAVFEQLGLKAKIIQNRFYITGKDWTVKKDIKISGSVSSQFISGLLLSSWNLPSELVVRIDKPIVSRSYLEMTLNLIKIAGGLFEYIENEDCIKIIIKKNNEVTVDTLKSELDISSLFALSGAALVEGSVQVNNWHAESQQPDMEFLNIFRKMNINFYQSKSTFKINKQLSWKAIDYDLANCPDLFPVLAVLCAFAEGRSKLHGAAHLIHKESNRIKKTSELLSLINCKHDILTDGLIINGQPDLKTNNIGPFSYNTDHDHRMAMAAGILKLKGVDINIEDPKVVSKSYPKFWSDIGILT